MRIAFALTLASFLACVLPAHGQASRAAAGAPSYDRADCPACQGAFEALKAYDARILDLDRQMSRAQARLDVINAGLKSGEIPDTAQRREQVRALTQVVTDLAAEQRRALNARSALDQALVDCNQKLCGGEGRGAAVGVAGGGAQPVQRSGSIDLFLATRDLFGTPQGAGPLLDVRAACLECLPIQQRLDDLKKQQAEAEEEYGRIAREYAPIQKTYQEVHKKSDAASSAADAYAAAQGGQRSADLDARMENALLDLRQAQRRLDENRKEIYAAIDEAALIQREMYATAGELEGCNRRRCGGDVTVGRVIGVTGNNPFEPSDPLGPKIVTGQPPVPGAIGSLQLSSASYGGGEGGAVLVVVMRVGGSSGNVSVSYATTPGTASQADFTAASGTLSWRDGDMSSKSFSIALTDDTQVEQTESFTVALSAPTGGASLGSPSTATITIADNDSTAPPQPAGAIQFSASSFTVMENAGSVTITATRTGGSAGEITVQYFTGPSSAVAGSDYQAVSGVLTWGVGDTGAKSFSVPIINDTLVEGPETFFVTLNNPTGGATLGAPATATVTINDDDVNTGPCGATGNAWTPNAGQYACSGSCTPNPSPRLSINGDLVTATSFASGGTATFQGCGQSLQSRESNLTYFGQANHRATITRSSDTNFAANIVSSGGGTCSFTCNRTGP